MKWVVLSLLFSFNAVAADWVRVNIPEAKCGDGKPYSVLVEARNPKKLLVEFMGGGACWDYDSCFKGASFFPWLHNYPIINSYSVFTANHSKVNPFKEHSKIYFPYCTADVFAGDHVAQYKKKTVHHYGRRNVELAIEYFKSKQWVDLSRVDDLVVYGASAGAIASLLHGNKVETLVSQDAQKLMIVDSPGLHFGATFWDKFNEDMKGDFKIAFGEVGLDVDFNDGVVSKRMGPVLSNYESRNWKMGFLIGLRDKVMSDAFGDISPNEQKEIILSTDGLPYIAKDYSNVKMWLRDTQMHTFMLSRFTATKKSEEGEKGSVFVEKLYLSK